MFEQSLKRKKRKEKRNIISGSIFFMHLAVFLVTVYILVI